MSVTFVKTKYEIIKETKYLRFTKLERPPDKKTDIVTISSISGDYLLGRIAWFPRWRQYCFYPYNDTVWNKGCMENVYEVIEQLRQDKNLET